MKKIILTITFALLLAPLVLLTKRFFQNSITLVPYSYTVKEVKAPKYTAPIVIIGDQMGENLYRYKTSLIQEISTGLSKSIEIDSLANSNFGLHRTLAELKKLAVWPKLIIYHGGSSEAYEKRFYGDQIDKIKDNLDLYDNDFWQTGILFMPSLSRFIYKPIKKIPLNPNIKPDTEKYSDFQRQKNNELIFKFYEVELAELAKEAKNHGSKIILLTTPVNLELKPARSCTKIEIQGSPTLSSIKEQSLKKDFKNAYALAATRSELLMADPTSYFLKGKYALKLGLLKEAKQSFIKANAFDCSLKNPNVIFNAIIRNTAAKYQIPIFDFHDFLYSFWGKNTLFTQDHIPQDLYMEKLTGYLGSKIKIMLSI